MILRGAEHLDPLSQFLYLDSRFSLADDLLLYGDKIAMASSLEVRVPFLDLQLLGFVERIPASLRVSLFTPKRLLRQALKSILPQSVLNRRKRNFAPPDSSWMGLDNSQPGIGSLLDENASVRWFLSPKEVSAIVQEQLQGKRDHRRKLFALLAFELWHRAFFRANENRLDQSEISSQSVLSITNPGRM